MGTQGFAMTIHLAPTSKSSMLQRRWSKSQQKATTTARVTAESAREHRTAAAGLHCGDWGKLVVVLLCMLFLTSVVAQDMNVVTQFFSPSYLNEGFCVGHRDSLLWSGHAISFYADTLAAIVMMCFVRLGRRKGLTEQALTPLSKNSYSLLGHGFGHMFLAIRTASASGGTQPVFGGLTMKQQLAVFLAFMPVWYGFMMDKTRSFRTTIVFTSFHNALQIFCLPSRFFFTHVLMSVLLNSAFRWLARPYEAKTRYYALEAWLVDVPILLASFGEALSCDAFLVHWGGHVWFDMVVPFGFFVYYLILINDPNEVQMKSGRCRVPKSQASGKALQQSFGPTNSQHR